MAPRILELLLPVLLLACGAHSFVRPLHRVVTPQHTARRGGASRNVVRMTDCKAHQCELAIVTGGGRGLGRAISKALAAAGCKVVVNYVEASADDANELVEELKKDGREAVALEGNVAHPEEADELVKQSSQAFGGIPVTILVNNAGILRDINAFDMTPKDWQSVIDVNLSGVWWCSRAAARQMVEHGRGRIVNIASMVGQIGNPDQANYTAAKAGVLGLTRSNGKEWAEKGICVNAVCPGYIESCMTSQHDREELEARIPMRRLGTPDEVAGLVKYLALDPSAAYITGHSFTIDGGCGIGAT